MLLCTEYSKEKCEFIKNCSYNKHCGIYDNVFNFLINIIYCPLTRNATKVTTVTKLEYWMREIIKKNEKKE